MQFFVNGGNCACVMLLSSSMHRWRHCALGAGKVQSIQQCWQQGHHVSMITESLSEKYLYDSTCRYLWNVKVSGTETHEWQTFSVKIFFTTEPKISAWQLKDSGVALATYLYVHSERKEKHPSDQHNNLGLSQQNTLPCDLIYYTSVTSGLVYTR